MITRTRKNQKGAKWDQPASAIIFAVLVFGIIGLLAFSNYRVNQRRADLLKQIGDLGREIRLLEENNDQLKQGIQEAQKDAHWEEKVREQGYKKPGEKQVVVLPPKEENAAPTEQSQNLWQKFLDPIRNFLK